VSWLSASNIAKPGPQQLLWEQHGLWRSCRALSDWRTCIMLTERCERSQPFAIQTPLFEVSSDQNKSYDLTNNGLFHTISFRRGQVPLCGMNRYQTLSQPDIFSIRFSRRNKSLLNIEVLFAFAFSYMAVRSTATSGRSWFGARLMIESENPPFPSNKDIF